MLRSGRTWSSGDVNYHRVADSLLCKTRLERNSALSVCALSRPGDFGEAGVTLSMCLRKLIVDGIAAGFAPTIINRRAHRWTLIITSISHRESRGSHTDSGGVGTSGDH